MADLTVKCQTEDALTAKAFWENEIEKVGLDMQCKGKVEHARPILRGVGMVLISLVFGHVTLAQCEARPTVT